jgi:hypothetical protein
VLTKWPAIYLQKNPNELFGGETYIFSTMNFVKEFHIRVDNRVKHAPFYPGVISRGPPPPPDEILMRFCLARQRTGSIANDCFNVTLIKKTGFEGDQTKRRAGTDPVWKILGVMKGKQQRGVKYWMDTGKVGGEEETEDILS